jgi:hypothetical protein
MFRLELAPAVSYEFTLSELLDQRQAPVTYDQLPASFRAEAEKYAKTAPVRPPVRVSPPP